MTEDTGQGIFANEDEVIENLKSAADGMGLDTKGLETNQPEKAYYAKRNCNWCYGRGTVKFAPNGVHVRPRRKEPSKAYLKAVKWSPRKLAKHMQTVGYLTSGSARIGRNTSLSEGPKDAEWREENVIDALCKCIRIVEEDV